MPARRARTRRIDLTSRPRRGTDRERPRPGWDATAGSAVPRPAVARPVARRAARSRPASPRGVRVRGTRPAPRPRRARTSRPGSSRPSHQRSARRASRTPSRRPHRWYSSELQLHLGQVFTAPRPRGTVADAYRQALNTGLRPVAACRHLTTAERGWSTKGPPHRGAGIAKPSPGGGRGNNQDEASMSSPSLRDGGAGPPIAVKRCRCAASLRSVLSDQLFDCAAAAHGHAARRG